MATGENKVSKHKGKFERDEDSEVPAELVKKFHHRADTDSSMFAIHHTLGLRKDQASSGAHTHNGKDSLFILKGKTISGSRGGNVALASVISLLVSMGATDNTTP